MENNRLNRSLFHRLFNIWIQINLFLSIISVQKVEEEGKHAIESPGLPNQYDIPPEDYTLRDLEQRAVIDPQSLNSPEVIKLQRILIDWLNDELAEQRIIVQSIEEDLYDGQVRHFIIYWVIWNRKM